MTRWRAGLIAGLCALAIDVTAQTPRFRSGVDVVALDVCVKDVNGRPTSSLTADDFLILDNNVPQQVTFFASEGRVPLAVSLLVDSSQSMTGARLERARTAAAGFIDTLRPDDLVEVVSFNSRVNLRYPLGGDHDRARLSLEDVTAAGMTGLYDAILIALRDLQRAQRRAATEYRSVIVVLSDGDDNHSRVPFDEILEEVRRSGVLVYTISLRADARDRTTAPQWQMSALAFDSGARAMAVNDPSDLTQTYQDITEELLHLYRLGYVPAESIQDGSWRRIAVRVPAKVLVVRTRAGYYAPSGASAR